MGNENSEWFRSTRFTASCPRICVLLKIRFWMMTVFPPVVGTSPAVVALGFDAAALPAFGAAPGGMLAGVAARPVGAEVERVVGLIADAAVRVPPADVAALLAAGGVGRVGVPLADAQVLVPIGVVEDALVGAVVLPADGGARCAGAMPVAAEGQVALGAGQGGSVGCVGAVPVAADSIESVGERPVEWTRE